MSAGSRSYRKMLTRASDVFAVMEEGGGGGGGS